MWTLDEIARLVGTGVTCIVPSVAWATFVATRTDKALEHQRNALRLLKRLASELDRIGAWAGRPYSPGAHDPNWYNPFWRISLFATRVIDEFNDQIPAEEFGSALTLQLADFASTVDQFRQLCHEHAQLLESADQHDPSMRARVRAHVPTSWLQPEGARQPESALAQLRELSDSDKTFLRRHYDALERIHVVGLGDSRNPRSLHAHFIRLKMAVEHSREQVKSKSQLPWIPLGNVVAALVGAVGIAFLVLAACAAFQLLWPRGCSVPPGC